MPYSAVTQPLPVLRRNPGTRSSTLAVQITLVLPALINTDPFGKGWIFVLKIDNPDDLKQAALGLLGKAYAVATAPASALPKDIARFSKKLIWDRATEVAAAGLRVTLHERLRDGATQLLMDFIGSNYARLPDRISNPDDLAFAKTDFAGFDALRRRSVRGDVFAQAVAALLKDDLASMGASAFHRDLAEKISYRPAHISVLLSAAGPLPVAMSVVDSQGRRVVEPKDDTKKRIKRSPDDMDALNLAYAPLPQIQTVRSPFAATPAAKVYPRIRRPRATPPAAERI